MRRGKSRLTSLPFIRLYLVAAGAIFLAVEHRGSKDWFPIAVGFVAAMALWFLIDLLMELALERRGRVWPQILFLAICAAAAAAGGAVLLKPEPLVGLMLLGISAIGVWAALGMYFGWPGFRRRFKPNECQHCGYDLSGNVSGVCPECGTPIDDPDGDE